MIPESQNSSKNDYYEVKAPDFKKPPLSQTRPTIDKIEPKRNLLMKATETFDSNAAARIKIIPKNKVLSP